jgi:hypothetical protein
LGWRTCSEHEVVERLERPERSEEKWFTMTYILDEYTPIRARTFSIRQVVGNLLGAWDGDVQD